MHANASRPLSCTIRRRTTSARRGRETHREGGGSPGKSSAAPTSGPVRHSKPCGEQPVRASPRLRPLASRQFSTRSTFLFFLLFWFRVAWQEFGAPRGVRRISVVPTPIFWIFSKCPCSTRFPVKVSLRSNASCSLPKITTSPSSLSYSTPPSDRQAKPPFLWVDPSPRAYPGETESLQEQLSLLPYIVHTWERASLVP